MILTTLENGFELRMGAKTLLAHSKEQPMLFVGKGQESIDMYRGNFHIEDYLEERCPLDGFTISGDSVRLFHGDSAVTVEFTMESGRVRLRAASNDPSINRLWLRLPAQQDEAVFGGGEQFSYLNLRGKRFEIFTREQGVGRNKSEYVTFLADAEKSGGDYDWTFFPAPTFISSRRYFFHLDNTCYSALDFSRDDRHEVELWSNSFEAVFGEAEDYKRLLTALTDYLGRQPLLPHWATEGIWLGIQGGTETVDKKLDYMEGMGTHVSAVWCQDWEGIRYTSFGKRLMWNWVYDETLYPRLPEKIKEWHSRGIKFMGYINPYVCEEKELYREAKEKGLLARRSDGEVYLVDFGEFYCGIVDFTNPAGWDWYKDVIKTHLLGIGLDGWMADFGEYLPTDCVLYSGESPMTAHNRWPALWARLNYEVLEETDNLDKVAVYFRAGGTGSQRYSQMMWAGDQNVDWSLDDGLASVVVAALSSAMSGHGVHTSDAGGYTTLYHLKRSKELLLRWLEFCAFTPVLRTHEGNRPDSNWQFDSDEETARHTARCSRLHTALAPYLRDLIQENHETGVPVMRPLFLEYPQDTACLELKYQYLLGGDLLVAPVYIEGAQSVELYIPEDGWYSLWSGEVFTKGRHMVAAPMGKPAVFCRQGSGYTQLFESLKTI